jgi:hypothetical protein
MVIPRNRQKIETSYYCRAMFSDPHVARPPTATTLSHDGGPMWGSNSMYKKNLQNEAICMRPLRSPLHHYLLLIPVMAALVAIAVYSFVLINNLID